MVLGDQKNTFKDSSGKVEVSVWEASAGSAEAVHSNQEIEVGAAWVCIGGGGKGSENPGHLLTASYPFGLGKGWRVSSKDHLTSNPWDITLWAIGMRINGMSREALLDNLHFGNQTSPPGSQNNFAVIVPTDQALLGGGFRVGNVQQPNSGNFATGSFLDSTYQWRARSKDMEIITSLPVTVFTVAINKEILKNINAPAEGTNIFGYANVMFDSAETLPDSTHPVSTAKIHPDYALCGGGAVTHHSAGKGNYLWALEPVSEITEDQEKQTFTGRAKDHHREDPSTLTAYALGVQVFPV